MPNTDPIHLRETLGAVYRASVAQTEAVGGLAAALMHSRTDAAALERHARALAEAARATTLLAQDLFAAAVDLR